MNRHHPEPSDQDISNCIQRAMNAAPIPSDTRQHIWEDLMQSTVAPLPGIISTSATTPTTAAGTHRGGRFTESRLARGVARWQAPVSLAVVVAVLVSLMGIAWQRGILDGPPSTPAGQFPALAQEGTPFAPTECVAHGPLRHTAAELEAMSYSDWSARQYQAISPATTAQQQAAIDAIDGWYTCLQEQNQGTMPPEITTYYSDRYQFISLANTFANPRTEEIRELDELVNPVQQIVKYMPLPLNAPAPTGERGLFTEFGQVYRLVDGRYGVVTGSFTLTDLTYQSNTGLIFYGFVEIDGKMYIDDQQFVCVSAIADSLNGRPIKNPSPEAGQSFCG